MNRERDYYKAIRRAVTAINSPLPLKDRIDTLLRSITRTMKCGASLLILDTTRTKLVHSNARGLPQFYLRKGLIDITASLGEIESRSPVAVNGIHKKSRVQFPLMAAKAGITSIMGVPVQLGDNTVGSIRVYAGDDYEFTAQDKAFVTTVANLAAIALQGDTTGVTPETTTPSSVIRKASKVSFAHPSEEEFAGILDFYNIEWVYEPRSFPLKWEGDTATEMFTPDFYLPGLDLFIELTTLKQGLVTNKNRKLRRLKQLHPEIKISLLYKHDYDRLLAKYGCGPLSQNRAQGIRQVLYSAPEIENRVKDLAAQISKDYALRRPLLIGVQRGFICFMADLIRQITIPIDIDFMAISYYSGEAESKVKITKDIDLSIKGRHLIMVEDIIDTGITLGYLLNHLKKGEPAGLAVCTLLDRKVRRLADISIDYVGFNVPDEFVVGYGLDYHEEYRNLPFIGIPIVGKTGQKKN